MNFSSLTRRQQWLLVGALAAGAALRLGHYLARPSLSIDETMLALAVAPRSYHDLLHLLDYDQTAPPLFLWVLRFSVGVGGVNEFALRFLPLAAGVIMLPLLWRLSRRLLPPEWALFTVALAAFAPALVQFSVIAKPYITDATLALTLVVLSIELADHPDRAATWWWLAAIGVIAALGSVTAPFILGGLGLVLAWSHRRHRAVIARLAVCGVVWATAFVPVYIRLYAPVAHNTYMRQFWDAAFLAPGNPASWLRLGDGLLLALVRRSPPWYYVPPFGALLVLGLAALKRHAGHERSALIAAPFLVTAVASLLQRYPLAPRLLVFLAPLSAVLVGAAVWWLADRSRRLGIATAVILLILVAGIDITHPYGTPSTRAAVQLLEQRLQPGEPVYVSASANLPWVFYSTDWHRPDTNYLRAMESWAGPGGPAFHNAPSRGRGVTNGEGDSLVWSRSGREELYGLAPGIQWREVTRMTSYSPDSGWAPVEAERIRAAARPTIWLLVATAYVRTAPELLGAVRRLGGTPEFHRIAGGTRIYRFRFSDVSPARRGPEPSRHRN